MPDADEPQPQVLLIATLEPDGHLTLSDPTTTDSRPEGVALGEVSLPARAWDDMEQPT